MKLWQISGLLKEIWKEVFAMGFDWEWILDEEEDVQSAYDELLDMIDCMLEED